MQYIIRKFFFSHFFGLHVKVNILLKIIQMFSVTDWETHGKFYNVWAVHAIKRGRS